MHEEYKMEEFQKESCVRGYHITAAGPCRELYLLIAECCAGEYFLYWPRFLAFSSFWTSWLAAAIASLDMVVESDPLGSGRSLIGFK